MQGYTAIRKGVKEQASVLEAEITATGLDIGLRAPASASVEARDESALDERVYPQYPSGVWLSIGDTVETEMLGGVSNAVHTLEVLTWVNVQDTRRPDAESHGTAANGYLTALFLARAVDVALRKNLPGCSSVYLVRPVGGAKRVPQTPKFPSVHTVRWTYEAFQRVRTPLRG